MTVYDLIHNSLKQEADRTESNGQVMVRRILQEMQQRKAMPGQAPPSDGS